MPVAHLQNSRCGKGSGAGVSWSGVSWSGAVHLLPIVLALGPVEPVDRDEPENGQV